MARSRDDAPRGRFARSGHTAHSPRAEWSASSRPDQAETEPTTSGVAAPADGWGPTAYAGAPPASESESAWTPPGRYRPDHPQAHTTRLPGSGRRTDAVRAATPGESSPRAGAGASSRPRGRPAALTRAALGTTSRAARVVTVKVIDASKADGADRSGLTALIWNQVLSYGTDAMITVALAGTVFFGASTHAQRGNVLLYLLVTMAPFAVVAPVIGPVLDRFPHGRRWTMAGTAVGRAILAMIMAQHPSELLVLYPCALGCLVLSKAYTVLRAAAAPRLVPPDITLTQANARLTIFGLGSTMVLGAVVGSVIKITGSYSLGLWLSALGFAVCAVFAARLPRQVDAATSQLQSVSHDEVRRRSAAMSSPSLIRRLQAWAARGFEPHVVVALQGESALRLLSGLLTIYLAFWVESSAHGFDAAWQLGAVIAAAGAGNISGTAIGTRLKLARPEAVIVTCVVAAAVVCLVVALAFGIVLAVAGMYLASIANALSKIALDALIQRDVPESLRASSFARSETFLQLAWVVGAAIGVVLPSSGSSDGAVGFWTAGALVGIAAVVVTLRMRVMRRATTRPDAAAPHGSVGTGAAPAPTAPPPRR